MFCYNIVSAKDRAMLNTYTPTIHKNAPVLNCLDLMMQILLLMRL